MTDSDYPRFLCRPGSGEEAWGYRIDVGRALDADDEKAKLADGWYFNPGDWDGKPQLDHDHDGKAGGSVLQQGASLPALRQEYQDKFGKRPFMGWGEDELRRRIGDGGS